MERIIAQQGKPVTPSDSSFLTDLDGNNGTQGGTIYVGVAGDVNVLPKGNTLTSAATSTGTTGGAILYKNVPAGTFIPVSVCKVFSTGTTATNIIYHPN